MGKLVAVLARYCPSWHSEMDRTVLHRPAEM